MDAIIDVRCRLVEALTAIAAHYLPLSEEAIRQVEAGEFDLARQLMVEDTMLYEAARTAIQASLPDLPAGGTLGDALDGIGAVLGAITGTFLVDMALEDHDPVRAADAALLEARFGDG